MKKYIATIETEAGKAKLFVEKENKYKGSVYVIMAKLPDGTIETPEVQNCATMNEVTETIEAAWGSGNWNLEFAE